MSFYNRIQRYPALTLVTVILCASLLTILIPMAIDGQWYGIANDVTNVTDRRWHDVAVILSAIVLESFPFVLIGSLISSSVEVFVPTGWLLRLIPRGGLGIMVASLLGLILPVCDCGTAPIVRKLIENGRGHRIATAFMLASPTVNPITLISTFYAFGGDVHWPLLRGLVGLFVAWMVSWVIPDTFSQTSDEETKPASSAKALNKPEMNLTHVMAGLSHVIPHTLMEFYRVMPLLVLSASITAVLQVFIPLQTLFGSGKSIVVTVLSAMLMAVIFSLCSQADAFIARSLSVFVPTHGILAFMLAGQMIDLRTMFIFSDILTKRAMSRVIVLTAFAILLTCIALSLWRHSV